MLVPDFYSAHYDRSTNDEPFQSVFGRLCFPVIESAQNHLKLTHNRPIIWNPNFNSSEKGKHRQHGLVRWSDGSTTKVDLTAAHNRRHIAAPEILRIDAAFQAA